MVTKLFNPLHVSVKFSIRFKCGILKFIIALGDILNVYFCCFEFEIEINNRYQTKTILYQDLKV